ncbi:branched-chain amino acid ABC transporter substrate-binding protein [Paenibacillus humicola]|uniref:branched-chain amino acid ABC transporter substrate-binding protein n=1 Tax=Paenibacillus humicola TaxID=3110540 RepID=UPI00237ABE97|nr:branched-chain amino acid ABC transporter substrate-binding protein [Paenibacillus humicola]
MRNTFALPLYFISALLLVLLAKYGSGPAGIPPQSGHDRPLTVIGIATQSPLSGGSAIPGEAIKLGAEMSLDDHRAEFEKLGFRLKLIPYDDQAEASKGVANAALIGADPSILGVVGHLDSDVSVPSSVIYEKYNLVMVSPASTSTEVTDRQLKTVNRIVARDDVQGPSAADYAVKTAGASRLFVIHDNTSYGQGLAESFVEAAKRMGARIAGYEAIARGDKDFNGVLNQVLRAQPELIFFSGRYSEAGILLKQAREKGVTARFMGGDGLDSSGIVRFAGSDIRNALYSSPVADITRTDSGKRWADAYRRKFGKPADGFSAYAYDSMSVLLNGLKTAILANGGKLPSREQVREAVRGTHNFQGVSTKVSFNGKGDNKFARMFIYRFEDASYPGRLVSEIG